GAAHVAGVAAAAQRRSAVPAARSRPPVECRGQGLQPAQLLDLVPAGAGLEDVDPQRLGGVHPGGGAARPGGGRPDGAACMKLDRRWIAGGLVAAVLVVPFLLKGVGGDPAVEVEIEPAAERDIRPTILASGVLAYRNEVNLTAEVVAKVEAILVEE